MYSCSTCGGGVAGVSIARVSVSSYPWVCKARWVVDELATKQTVRHLRVEVPRYHTQMHELEVDRRDLRMRVERIVVHLPLLLPVVG